jgi:pyridoxine 5-phosphate synthase
MTKLSVNINKIATLRNARGENLPDILKMAQLIESLGAHGITVHPRPDQRHITRADVVLLKQNLISEFNIEGYPSGDFIAFMQEIKPEQITLVPDSPHVLTSNAGFKLTDDFPLVLDVIKNLKRTGSRISLFIEPKDFIDRDIDAIVDTGADRIELYTKAFADHPHDDSILAPYIDVANRVFDRGLGINAGHDLNLLNLGILLDAIPFIAEVSIGHALISDALLLGLPETIKRYCAITNRLSVHQEQLAHKSHQARD